MKHQAMLQGLVGDISEPFTVRQAGSRSVYATRLKIITDDKDGKVFAQTWKLECWGEQASALIQKIAVGSTVFLKSFKFKNAKYTDSSGQEKWDTVIQVWDMLYCGPSTEAAKEQGQQTQQGQGYQQGYQQPVHNQQQTQHPAYNTQPQQPGYGAPAHTTGYQQPHPGYQSQQPQSQGHGTVVHPQHPTPQTGGYQPVVPNSQAGGVGGAQQGVFQPQPGSGNAFPDVPF